MISVLYVDDESLLLELGKAFLERNSALSVDTSVSAKEALKKMKEIQYDAIISDYQMPEMDGIKFLQTVRRKGNRIPFIIFTGRGREEVIIEALNSGVDFYLQKGGDSKAQFAELKNVVLRAVKQKKAEQALKESERKFRAIFDHTFQFIGLMTVDGTLIEANRTALEFSGIKESDVIGKPFWETPWWSYSKELQESLRAALRRAATGEFVRFETTFIAADGSQRIFDISLKPVVDETGNVILLIPEGRDITDLKRAKDDLNKSTLQLQSILKGCPIPQFVIDKNHRVIHWNDALEQYSGIKAGEVIGTSQHWRAFYRENRPCMADLLVDGVIEKIPQWYEGKYAKSAFIEDAYEATDLFPHMGESGTWLYFTAAPIRDEYGEIVGAVETLEDVTKRRDMENALRKSRSHLHSIIKGSPIPQFVIDKNHRVIHWNDALEQYSGIKAEEVIGTSQHWRAFYRENRPCMADLLVDGAIGKIPQWYEGKYAKSAFIEDAYEATDFFPHMGERGTWLYFTAAPIRDEYGEIVGAVETLEDVTERKFTEDALKKALEKLKLLSSITRHDIANQVTIVRGCADIAMTDYSDPTLRDLLSKIDTAGSTIVRQIEFMRVYEKLGLDAPGWHNVCNILLHLHHENASLTCSCHNIEIFADPMLERVFFNLVDNATRHGERVTAIAVRSESGPDGLSILVEDDGIGIPNDMKERIFEKGYGRNTGLGLFLSREILAITGISLHETGTPGEGARFELCVPKGGYRIID